MLPSFPAERPVPELAEPVDANAAAELAALTESTCMPQPAHVAL